MGMLGFSDDWQVPMKAIEFELALGTEDLRANGFAACLEQAARDSGFEILFNIPSTDGQPWQRLAAVGTIDDGEAIMVFVALSDSGNLIEIQPDLTDAPHLQAFAEAYFQLMFCQSTDRAAMAD